MNVSLAGCFNESSGVSIVGILSAMIEAPLGDRYFAMLERMLRLGMGFSCNYTKERVMDVNQIELLEKRGDNALEFKSNIVAFESLLVKFISAMDTDAQLDKIIDKAQKRKIELAKGMINDSKSGKLCRSTIGRHHSLYDCLNGKDLKVESVEDDSVIVSYVMKTGDVIEAKLNSSDVEFIADKVDPIAGEDGGLHE